MEIKNEFTLSYPRDHVRNLWRLIDAYLHGPSDVEAIKDLEFQKFEQWLRSKGIFLRSDKFND